MKENQFKYLRDFKNGPERDKAVGEVIEQMKADNQPIEAIQSYISQQNEVQREEKRQRDRRNNKDFTQIYPAGWQRLRSLMKIDKNAAAVYAFLCEHMGPDASVSASRATLAEALSMGERTISRHIKTLESLDAIVILKMGTQNVYCLNPAEVWKSFDTAKPYAAFNTGTLIGKKENPFVKKRLTTLLNGKVPEQSDMFEEEEDMPQVAAE